MMRLILPLLCFFMLAGCSDQNEDLVNYINQVKARKSMTIEQMPEMVAFKPLSYSETGTRNPFSIPRPEMARAKTVFPKNCPQPNLARAKGPLERFDLDNLNMHGTLGSDKHLWGLIRSNSGELFRVAPGDYIGLNHGKIRRITKNYIELSELVLTGKGCWQARKKKLPLTIQGNS